MVAVAKNTLAEPDSFIVFVPLMFYNSFISRFGPLILLIVKFIRTHIILLHATIIHKIFETNSSFHVK